MSLDNLMIVVAYPSCRSRNSSLQNTITASCQPAIRHPIPLKEQRPPEAIPPAPFASDAKLRPVRIAAGGAARIYVSSVSMLVSGRLILQAHPQ